MAEVDFSAQPYASKDLKMHFSGLFPWQKVRSHFEFSASKTSASCFPPIKSVGDHVSHNCVSIDLSFQHGVSARKPRQVGSARFIHTFVVRFWAFFFQYAWRQRCNSIMKPSFRAEIPKAFQQSCSNS